MSTGRLTDLGQGGGDTSPYNLLDYVSTASGTLPTDWEIDAVSGLTETSTGPHCDDDTITCDMTFTAEGQHFDWLSGHNPNYANITTTNCTLNNQAGRTFTLDPDKAVGTDETWELTASYSDPFNIATDEGTTFSVSGTITAFKVICDSWQMTDCDGDGNSDDAEITYTIECGAANFDIVLERKPEGDADSSYTQVNTDTVSSRGQHTICDLDAPTDQNYTYRVTVTDADTDTDDCEIPAFHTQ